jgi:hypothetical protein
MCDGELISGAVVVAIDFHEKSKVNLIGCRIQALISAHPV